MALHYLDTSAAVAAHTHEAMTARVQDWLGERAPGELAVSPWVMTEFESALSMKLRTGQLTLETRGRVMAEWQRFRQSSTRLLGVTALDFDAAGRFAARHELALRAGDALHLAVAVAHACVLVTLDERLAAAALAVGVPVAAI